MSTFTVTDLVDPHEFQQRYPNVKIINDVYKNNIKVTDYVKLRRNGAYFWVEVTHIDGDTFTGKIYHNLICNAKFTIGDYIVFGKCYIFDIYDYQTFGLIPRDPNEI